MPFLIYENPRIRPHPLMARLGEQALTHTAGPGGRAEGHEQLLPYLHYLPHLSSDPGIPWLEIGATDTPVHVRKLGMYEAYRCGISCNKKSETTELSLLRAKLKTLRDRNILRNQNNKDQKTSEKKNNK